MQTGGGACGSCCLLLLLLLLFRLLDGVRIGRLYGDLHGGEKQHLFDVVTVGE